MKSDASCYSQQNLSEKITTNKKKENQNARPGPNHSILETDEYRDWFDQQTAKEQVQIEKRLSKIETEGYFGHNKVLADDVWELKWDNGRRVYYAYIPKHQILLLLGGNKNGQNKDINYAKKILRKYTETEA